MTYDFDTDALVACLAFANTPRSFFQSLVRQEVVGTLARHLTPGQLNELARNATASEITTVDSAVAYAAIAALALKNFNSDVEEQLANISALPLPWARPLANLVREYGVPTIVADLTPRAFRESAMNRATTLVNIGSLLTGPTK